MLINLLKRELLLAWANRAELVQYYVFVLVAVTLFPFAVGPDVGVLSVIGVGVVWVCALLALMLTMPRIYHEDFMDGSLTQIWLQGLLPESIVMTKVLAHWLVSGLPIVIAAPLLLTMMRVPNELLMPAMWSLLMGTPMLSLAANMVAALVIGTKRSSMVGALLLLPLLIPILIFAVGAVTSDTMQPIWFMLGIFLLLLPMSIWFSVLALKGQINSR